IAPRLVGYFKRHIVWSPRGLSVDRAAAAASSGAIPVLWFLFLRLAIETGRAAGLDMSIAASASALLIAWIAIRLLSNVVRNPFWSHIIFVTAWHLDGARCRTRHEHSGKRVGAADCLDRNSPALQCRAQSVLVAHHLRHGVDAGRSPDRGFARPHRSFTSKRRIHLWRGANHGVEYRACAGRAHRAAMGCGVVARSSRTSNPACPKPD